EQQSLLVADRTQCPQEACRRHSYAALALYGLDDDRAGLRRDCFLYGVDVAKGHMVEARKRLAEAFEIFFGAGGRERCKRASVERALKCDHSRALRRAVYGVVFARDLDRAFHRLGAGIAEKYRVREACVGDAL